MAFTSVLFTRHWCNFLEMFISVLLAIMESKSILIGYVFGNVNFLFDFLRTASYTTMIIPLIVKFQASSFSEPIVIHPLLEIFFTSLGALMYILAGSLGLVHWYKYPSVHAYYTYEEVTALFAQHIMAFLLAMFFVFELVAMHIIQDNADTD